MSSISDLTPQARIRIAAIELFGEQGFDKATVRAIAERAGVSPALVIHHYGSKDGLRRACDDWVLETMTSEKAFVAAGGSLPQMQAYLADHPELGAFTAYLVANLRHGGAIAEDIFDRLCDMTEEVLATGEEAGTMRRGSDPVATAAVLAAYGAGAALVGDLLAHRLGGATLLDPQVYERYGAAAIELFTRGLFTDDRYVQQVVDTPAHPSPEDQR